MVVYGADVVLSKENETKISNRENRFMYGFESTVDVCLTRSLLNLRNLSAYLYKKILTTRRGSTNRR